MKRIYDETTGLWSITEIEPVHLAEIQASVLMTYLSWKGANVEISDEVMDGLIKESAESVKSEVETVLPDE